MKVIIRFNQTVIQFLRHGYTVSQKIVSSDMEEAKGGQILLIHAGQLGIDRLDNRVRSESKAIRLPTVYFTKQSGF